MITVRHLEKKFGNLAVLKDVSCEIEKGEVISIIGPSGTGKSTFLRCLNLLEQPSGGEIIIDGENVLEKGCDLKRLRKKVGMVFQSFNLFSHLMVVENVMLGQTKLLKRSKQEAYDEAIKLLEAVGLKDKAYSFPEELSGGQKQRVAIARTLSMQPEIVLFDEPTSALDPTMVGEVLSVIRKLAKEGLTMLVVTHEMNFARDASTRVFFMDEGVIYEDGPPQQIFENPLREKTRNFIQRIKQLRVAVASKSFDFYNLNSQIEEFCKNQFIESKTSRNVQLLFEEIAMQKLLPSMPDDAAAFEFALDYSQNDKKLDVIFEWTGEKNPLDDCDEDDFSLMIINRIAPTRDFSIDADGLCKLKLRIKSK